MAQLDKAPVYETGDYWFESSRVHHLLGIFVELVRVLSSLKSLPINDLLPKCSIVQAARKRLTITCLMQGISSMRLGNKFTYGACR